MSLSGLVASRKQPKQLVAGSLTLRQMSVLTGLDFSRFSDRPAQGLESMSRPMRRFGKH